MKKIYDWVLKWSGHPRALPILCFIAFIEASFFPIPIYPLLFAMSIQNPRRSLRYGVATAAASVTGALLGYGIGYGFWEVIQDFVFKYIFSKDLFDIAAAHFQDNTFLALAIGSLTPVPFKVFTITGGAMHVPIIPFILGAICGRSPRFIIIGLLFYFKGEQVKYWIEKHFTTFMCVVSAVLILAVVLYKLLR